MWWSALPCTVNFPNYELKKPLSIASSLSEVFYYRDEKLTDTVTLYREELIYMAVLIFVLSPFILERCSLSKTTAPVWDVNQLLEGMGSSWPNGISY